MKFDKRLLLFGLLLLVVSALSLTGIDKFYYWKDDWAFLWTNEYSPNSIFREFGTSGTGWEVKTGLFMLPYARLYSEISYQTLQLSGVFFKFINSCILAFLAYTLTKKKSASVLTGLLYTGYSGGADVYTWHRVTATAVGFSALAFAFHNLFIESQKRVYLVGIGISALLAMCSFFGRAIGLFPLLTASALMHFYIRPSKFLGKYILLLVLVLGGLVVLTRSTATTLANASYSVVIASSIKNIDVLFSNVGNLIRIPFFPLKEEGGLVGAISPLSLGLGRAYFLISGIVFVLFLMKRTRPLVALTSVLMWMALIFIPNWMYAGGGPTVMVGSAHRYMAGLGMGVVLLMGMAIARLSRAKQVVASVILLILFMNYSNQVIKIEAAQRHADLVIPIYKKIIDDTRNDPLPRALIVHTTRNNLVTGWLAYAYAYFKGLDDYSEFPTVFSNRDAAAEWICSPDAQKDTVAMKYGAPDYQSGRDILPENIYSWSIDTSGRIVDETDSFRERVSKCM